MENCYLPDLILELCAQKNLYSITVFVIIVIITGQFGCGSTSTLYVETFVV